MNLVDVHCTLRLHFCVATVMKIARHVIESIAASFSSKKEVSLLHEPIIAAFRSPDRDLVSTLRLARIASKILDSQWLVISFPQENAQQRLTV